MCTKFVCWDTENKNVKIGILQNIGAVIHFFFLLDLDCADAAESAELLTGFCQLSAFRLYMGQGGTVTCDKNPPN